MSVPGLLMHGSRGHRWMPRPGAVWPVIFWARAGSSVGVARPAGAGISNEVGTDAVEHHGGTEPFSEGPSASATHSKVLPRTSQILSMLPSPSLRRGSMWSTGWVASAFWMSFSGVWGVFIPRTLNEKTWRSRSGSNFSGGCFCEKRQPTLPQERGADLQDKQDK